MGEPGGLPSMGSHRDGHDWSNLAAAVAAYTRADKLYSTADALGLKANPFLHYIQEYLTEFFLNNQVIPKPLCTGDSSRELVKMQILGL